ncbi:4Fe-4S dicluster domain-containing protein [Myxococcota bacterium]|nr:4Fe-4S dicluster domain-containing protein [Myxococcota bacterium]
MGGLDRRGFLKVLGTGAAAATASACTARPLLQHLFPYVYNDPRLRYGEPTDYASMCTGCGAGCGVLVRTREGRPVKVEGNPADPLSEARLCARGQAQLQDLYNPDRVPGPLERRGEVQAAIPWDAALTRLSRAALPLLAAGGARIALLTRPTTGTMDALLARFAAATGARWVAWHPADRSDLRAANRIAYGLDSLPTWRIDRARALVSFGADFLGTWLLPVAFTRMFTEMHAFRGEEPGRFAQVEPRLSLTGQNADQWIPVRPGGEAALALGVARSALEMRGTGAVPGGADLAPLLARWDDARVSRVSGTPPGTSDRLAGILARDGLALPPDTGSSSATAAALATSLLNQVIGAPGERVSPDLPTLPGTAHPYSAVVDLVGAMERGEVDVLLVHGANPAYELPGGLAFAEALARVPLVVATSPYPDETSALAHLVLPHPGPFEGWTDAEPVRGVHVLGQPLVEPLYDTRHFGDVLLALARSAGGEAAAAFPAPDFGALLRDRWTGLAAGSGLAWEAIKGRGVLGDLPPPTPAPPFDAAAVAAVDFEAAGVDPDAASPALVVHEHPYLGSGEGANLPWLQELPDPVVKAVWGSWIELHPETAASLGVAPEQVMVLRNAGGEVRAPAWIHRGVAPGVLALAAGQGHTRYGRYATGVGTRAAAVLPPVPDPVTGALARVVPALEVVPQPEREPVVRTAGSTVQREREIALAVPLAEALRDAGRTSSPMGRAGLEPSPWPEMYRNPHHPYERRWAMSVDLDRCTGCQACMVACMAENNVPFVGKEQVALGREMSWIWIERYVGGPESDDEAEADPARDGVRLLPMLCQQCDNAPCEPVCPVFAAYHNPEGLNVQVYNRCVGTRYCANNCPYKVRRFNWFEYTPAAPLPLAYNPDVTVRTMGVMEKCTFCIQRIQRGVLRARTQDRPLVDGEIVPACVQTCPAEALVFGDVVDEGSAVRRHFQDPRGYGALEDLATRPAVTYLKKVVRGGTLT